MKVTYKVDSSCTLEQDVRGIKDAFKLMSAMDEVFGVNKCGNCQSPNIKRRFRTANRKDNGAKCEYYDIKCTECKHEFQFGQKNDEGAPLFPKGWQPGFESEAPKRQKRSEPQYHEQESDDGYEERPRQKRSEPEDTGDGVPW